MTTTVFVPTKGRPQNVARLCQAWKDTRAEARLVFLMDTDDPTLDAAWEIVQHEPENVISMQGEPRRIGPWLNYLVPLIQDMDPWDVVGFMGDDHVPRTDRWDKEFEGTLQRQPGIAYGNDLFQGINLPTAVFMSAAVVDALGYFVPPGLQHMYLDNAWKAWGDGAGCLVYRPHTIIEHMHPQAAKGLVDDTYAQVWPFMGVDKPVWDEYAKWELPVDVAKIKLRLSQLVRSPV